LAEKGTHIPTAALPGAALPASGLPTLIQACLRGDRSAQRTLYEAYAAFIYGVIRRFVPDDALAEDIHSEAFFRIFKRLEQFRFEGAFEGWMRRIAVHAVADHFRRKQNDYTALNEATEEVAVTQDIDGPSRLGYKELLGMVHQLPALQRAVFNLFVFEQYAHKDIAALLGISEGNSRWHLNDARRRLKDQIKAAN
jgi:RNA polymerase sigma-70 factor (ECF subfamily)